MVSLDDDVVDIHLNKLVDWLISHGICPRRWRTKTVLIRAQIKQALSDMPEHEDVKQILLNSDLHYFNCEQIVSVLRETEKDTKSFFGNYGSKRMTDWLAVIQAFKVENVYIAEASQILMRMSVHDIPALKRQIAKCIAAQDDCVKAAVECGKKRDRLRRELISSCSSIGLTLDLEELESLHRSQLIAQVASLVADLPGLFDMLAMSLTPLRPIVDLYKSYRQFDSLVSVVPVLSLMLDRGNATVYELKYGEAPIEVQTEKIQFDSLESVGNANASVEDCSPSDDEIDWGAEASFDDDVMPDASSSAAVITVESDGFAGGVARGVESRSILEDTASRHLLLDDLFELSAFITSRLDSVSGESGEGGGKTAEQHQVISSMSPVCDPDLLAVENYTTLQEADQTVAGIIHKLTEDQQMGRLMTIQEGIRSPSTSSNAIHRLVDSLMHQQRLVDKVDQDLARTGDRQAEAESRQMALAEEVQRMAKEAQTLRRCIENEVSTKWLRNRPVNIMGVAKL